MVLSQTLASSGALRAGALGSRVQRPDSSSRVPRRKAELLQCQCRSQWTSRTDGSRFRRRRSRQVVSVLDQDGWSVPVLESMEGVTISESGVLCVSPSKCREMLREVRFANSVALLCPVRCREDAVELSVTMRKDGKAFEAKRFLHQIGDEEAPVSYNPITHHVSIPKDTEKLVLTSLRDGAVRASALKGARHPLSWMLLAPE